MTLGGGALDRPTILVADGPEATSRVAARCRVSVASGRTIS